MHYPTHGDSSTCRPHTPCSPVTWDCIHGRAGRDPRVSIPEVACRKGNIMRVKPFFFFHTRTGHKPVWLLLLSLALAQLAGAGASMPSPGPTVILRPSPAPPLRIDFNYNFANALPPFQKEPALPSKEIARGRVPTLPPTPLLRVITDHKLLLNTDHSGDFVAGKVDTYRSFYNGHVVFTNLACETPSRSPANGTCCASPINSSARPASSMSITIGETAPVSPSGTAR